MERQINISYPSYLANALKLNDSDFEKEMKMNSLVKLYELNKISSGIAAKILGISRLQFLDDLSKYKVSTFNYSDFGDLKEDMLNA